MHPNPGGVEFKASIRVDYITNMCTVGFRSGMARHETAGHEMAGYEITTLHSNSGTTENMFHIQPLSRDSGNFYRRSSFSVSPSLSVSIMSR